MGANAAPKVSLTIKVACEMAATTQPGDQPKRAHYITYLTATVLR